MLEITKQQAESFWTICGKYLAQKIDMRAVRELVSESANPRLTALSEIYVRLLESMSNKQGMPKSIGNVRRLSTVLSAFSPADVHKRYGLDWEALFDEIKRKIKPQSRMNKSVPQNYWVVLAKGALDSAAFLSRFKSGEHFAETVSQFAKSEILIPAFPKLLEFEIHGLGFALACDFLKESGWPEYAKPDVHTKKILSGVGLADGTDYGTFKAILLIAKYIGETPYTVDKFIWLAGSGNQYHRHEKFKTSREEFLRFYRKQSAANNGFQATSAPTGRHA
jgi:hypothetical protein